MRGRPDATRGLIRLASAARSILFAEGRRNGPADALSCKRLQPYYGPILLPHPAEDVLDRRITIQRSRRLRANETEVERKLWLLIRGRRLAGLKWRRQVPIGPYIVDFACLERLLIVECDGSQHAESPRDAVRDAWLTSEGYTVLRFWNHEILQNARGVADTILARAGMPF